MAELESQTVCIIPAFNEAPTVAGIARIAVEHPLIGRVFIIDDGSTDDTSEKARAVEGVNLITHKVNGGKGKAMRTGLDATDEPIVIFLDADLVGLKPHHITDLMKPVLEGDADMSVGLFRGGRIHTDLAHMITPSLSGQRTVQRSVIENMDMDSVGFAIERALTELWETGVIKVKEIIWKGVTHRTKEEKRGYIEGVRQRIGMFSEILKFEGKRIGRRLKNGKTTHSEQSDKS